MGLLYVQGEFLTNELASYGVTRTEEFVVWDPVFQKVTGKSTHNLEVDEFLMGQTFLSKIHPILVNGKFDVAYSVGVGEVLHLRTLCATVQTPISFVVYHGEMSANEWDSDAAIPFWVIGSDKVTRRAPQKRTILLLAGGQREEILLQFERPGRYVILQQAIPGISFSDLYGHPHDQF